MHQSIICAFVGALLINIVNVAQAAPTTRLPPLHRRLSLLTALKLRHTQCLRIKKH